MPSINNSSWKAGRYDIMCLAAIAICVALVLTGTALLGRDLNSPDQVRFDCIRVQNLSNSSCWHTVAEALEQAKEPYEDRMPDLSRRNLTQESGNHFQHVNESTIRTRPLGGLHPTLVKRRRRNGV